VFTVIAIAMQGLWPRERFPGATGVTYNAAAKPKSDLYRDFLADRERPPGRIARPLETHFATLQSRAPHMAAAGRRFPSIIRQISTTT